MQIKMRLTINLIVIILVCIVIILSFFILTHILFKMYLKDIYTSKIIKETAELKVIEDEYLLHPEERAKQQWQMKYGSLTDLIKKLKFKNSENAVLFNIISTNHKRIKKIFLEVADLYENNKTKEKSRSSLDYELKDRLISILLESSQKMVSASFNLHSNIERKLIKIQQKIGRLVLIILFPLFLIIILDFYFIRKRISQSIRKLEEGVNIAGGGNLDYKIKIDKEDEFGELANTFNEMTDKLKKSTTSIEKLNWEILNRKKTEEELKEKEEELNLILNSPSIMIFYKDLEGRYLFVNKAFAKALGRSKDEIVGKKCSDLFSKEIADQLSKHDEELIKSGKSELRTIEKYETSKGIRWANVMKVPLYDKRRDTVTIVGFAEDITEQKNLEEENKKLEAQLFQAQKMEAVGRLTGGIAHDFNNMLTIILGYSDFIVSKIKDSDFIYQPLQEMKKAALRSAELTQKLLAFSRQQIINPKRINLNEELSEMEKLLKRVIGEDIELKLMLSDNIWYTFLDSSQINQIVLNMAVNSRDAMPEGGILTIETANVTIDDYYCNHHVGFIPGDYIMLAISDTGIGMDKETQAHIFEPFFTTKQTGKGTGLGLSTVYGIVKQNKGYINCYSEPNKGTTFKIYFPRFIGKKEKVSSTVEITNICSGNETILLVEDEDIVRGFAKDILKQFGYNVLVASNPKDAINICKQYNDDIHLLLTDVVMPDMNGKKLYESISTIRPDIRILYMSGYTANAIAHRGILEKGTPFIHKPFTMNSLAKKVREVLDSN